MSKEGFLALVVAVVALAVYGSFVSNTHNPAYKQGFRVGTEVRQRSGMTPKSGGSALVRYCRRAPEATSIPRHNAAEWVAGYDAGCQGT